MDTTLTLFPVGIAPSQTFPALYKKTSTGAIQTWNVSVAGNIITTVFGQVDGARQVNDETIAAGKNIGKVNETTPEEQAFLEAKSRWERQKKKGYVETVDEAKNGQVDASVITGGINPMLAHKFSEQGHKITYPAYMQPKLDGHRCIAMVGDNGKVSLWGRTRKPINSMPHIVEELEGLGLYPGTILDGELYNHEYRDKFEELTSFIRQTEPKSGCEVVEYHVYDVVKSVSFEERWLPNKVRQLLRQTNSCKVVFTKRVEGDDEVTDFFTKALELGYEGAMIRNADSPYLNKRSYDLQKIKTMLDDEFEIVGVEAGRGKMADKAIFVCKLPTPTPDGKDTFTVKMKGALDNLVQYLERPELAVGRELVVQYQGLTTYGVPRFPVGLRLREDI